LESGRIAAKLDSALTGQINDIETAVNANTGYLTALTTVFSGITSLGNWLRRAFRKDAGTAGMATAETEIRTGGTATYVGTTDNLEAIKDAGGGGGGGGSATIENQELILDQLQAALTAASAVIPGGVSIIDGFPDSLTIGDSYTTALVNFIKVYVRDASNNPLTGIGTKNFIDADFSADLTVSQGSKASLVRADCTWVPAAGPVEGYLKVEFETDQTRRGTEGSATMQLIFKWTGLEKTIATQTVEWMARVTRTLQ
jgi:hypothetical protein